MVSIEVLFFDLGGTLITLLSGQRAQWIEGAKDSLSAFADKGYRLGLISNTGSLTRRELIDDLLPTDFPAGLFEGDLMILSSEVGVEKPALQIFAHAVDAAGTLPGRCLFCTEEMAHALACQTMGMRSIWLRPGLIETLADELPAA
jgi:FMN phosphatase YigB (HAD superfamily)